jgi:hypothetical protein
MRIYDKSVEDNDESSLAINIFLPQKDMPKPARGDFVVLLRLKVCPPPSPDWLILVNHVL